MRKATWFLGAVVTLAWLAISIPFTDYSMTSVFDIPNSPPTSHDGLQKVLQDITIAGNFCIVSIFLLYGMNRKWYLRDDYPNWLRILNLQDRFKKVFESSVVFTVTNTLLALLGLVSSIVLWFHVRILGRGLGYW